MHAGIAFPTAPLQLWQQGKQTWHFVADQPLGLILAVCVPHTWNEDAALALARAVLNETLTRHEPHLQPLLNATRGGPQLPVRLPDVTPILTANALRAVKRLTEQAQAATAQWNPSWMYFVYAPALMGDYRDPLVRPADAGTARGGRSSKSPGRRKGTGLFGCFTGGAAKTKFAVYDESFALPGRDTHQSSTALLASANGLLVNSQLGSFLLPAGAIGPLQHINLCESQQQQQQQGLLQAAVSNGVPAHGVADAGSSGVWTADTSTPAGASSRTYWEPSAVAAAVLQVKPPAPQGADAGHGADQSTTLAHSDGSLTLDGSLSGRSQFQRAASATAGAKSGGPAESDDPIASYPNLSKHHDAASHSDRYPELEDVELEMELQPMQQQEATAGAADSNALQLNGAEGSLRGSAGGKRMFSVVGVRVGMAMAVVAVPSVQPGLDAGRTWLLAKSVKSTCHAVYRLP